MIENNDNNLGEKVKFDSVSVSSRNLCSKTPS